MKIKELRGAVLKMYSFRKVSFLSVSFGHPTGLFSIVTILLNVSLQNIQCKTANPLNYL